MCPIIHSANISKASLCLPPPTPHPPTPSELMNGSIHRLDEDTAETNQCVGHGMWRKEHTQLGDKNRV